MSFANDTFTRANQSGWGTASDGESWVHLSGGSPTLAIASNEGTYTGATASTNYALGTNTFADGDISMRFEATATNDTVGLLFRCDATAANFYRINAKNTTLTIDKFIASASTTIGTATITYSANTFYWMKMRCIGSSIFGKFWADGSTEPATWNIAKTDTTFAAAGRYGVRMTLNLIGDTVSIDTFSVNGPQGGDTVASGRRNSRVRGSEQPR